MKSTLRRGDIWLRRSGCASKFWGATMVPRGGKGGGERGKRKGKQCFFAGKKSVGEEKKKGQ